MTKACLLAMIMIAGNAFPVGAQAAEPKAIGPAEGSAVDEESKLFNLPLPTAGGTQLWTDYRWHGGYRLQQNVVTGHWRLLDAKNVRRAWGSKSACLAVLNELDIPATPNRHIVILVHGLMRTRGSMKPLERAFADAGLDDVLRFSYASSRRSIGDHAKALRELLEHVPDDATFAFVGHSMGSTVVRRLLGDLAAGDNRGILPRCKAMVMLGPPNQGAAFASRLASTGVFGVVTGKGGLELGRDWEEFSKGLATPTFPFAIIAGDKSDSRLKNPLIDDQGDLFVTVDEAKLEGSTEFHTVPVTHTFLMSDGRCKAIAVRFIKEHR